MTNIIETFGDLSTLVDEIIKFQFKNTKVEQMFEQSLNIGKKLGSIVASIIDVHADYFLEHGTFNK